MYRTRESVMEMSCERVRWLGGVRSPVSATAVDVKELKQAAVVVTDPAALWERYVEWLYHNEDLALSLDVSRISFSPRFVEAMEPKVRHKAQGRRRSHGLPFILTRIATGRSLRRRFRP